MTGTVEAQAIHPGAEVMLDGEWVKVTAVSHHQQRVTLIFTDGSRLEARLSDVLKVKSPVRRSAFYREVQG
jgi:hypothetical protein